MGNSTENLNLYLTDMDTDGNDTFDFQRDLNDNNNKIDSAIGKLSNLTTEQQANLVSAINEIVSNLDGKTSKSLNDLNAVGQAILDKKVEVEALLAQNGYAKFSWKENNEISNLIIQWGKYNKNAGLKTTILFPLTFNSLFYADSITCERSSYSGVFSMTNTSAIFYCGSAGTDGSSQGFIWFAIGY